VKAYKELEEGAALYAAICKLFEELNEYRSRVHTLEERIVKKDEFEDKMLAIDEEFGWHKSLDAPLRYIEGGFNHWFTCVEYPEVEPTNNLGEQAIREHVVVRKIIGMFRSESGAERYQYISSMLASWNQRGSNMFEELDILLRKELCRS